MDYTSNNVATNNVATYAINSGPDTFTGSAIGGIAFFLVFLALIVAFYIYFAYCLKVIAEKTGTPNSWYAWVPILNIILMLQIARQSMWWLLAMLVPFVNIIVAIWIWMKIAEARRFPSWFGILMIISPVNLFILYYLAFKEHAGASPVPPVSIVEPPSSTPPTNPAV